MRTHRENAVENTGWIAKQEQSTHQFSDALRTHRKNAVKDTGWIAKQEQSTHQCSDALCSKGKGVLKLPAFGGRPKQHGEDSVELSLSYPRVHHPTTNATG